MARIRPDVTYTVPMGRVIFHRLKEAEGEVNQSVPNVSGSSHAGK